ncbi:hypothetical protein R1sor_019701 [Riccia sorocarpa]|uniref:Uncharacterized protein n=1 Tax=Riccia sorocarpa TaxID=122646 RepID=A0ABD3IEZ4_9MARC
MPKLAVGHREEATAPDAVRAAIAEFIATFLFVFIGLGSVTAYNKMYHEGLMTAAGLVAIALAHGLALTIAVASVANISGGHVNPAITFGLLVGGHITIMRSVVYWIGQIFGAILAAALLKWVIVSKEHESVPGHTLASGVSVWSGLTLEIVMTFALVFVVYATAVDPKRSSIGVLAPLAIGFTVLACSLVGLPYTGASMNPARSFGPALISWDWHRHWIYWLGPLIGAALAGAIYDGLFISEVSGTPVQAEEY